MNPMTLFDLAAERRALAERLLDMDLDDQTLHDTLEGESGALEKKACDIVAIGRALDSFVDAIKAEEKRLAARRKTIEARGERLRQYVRDAMLLAGVEKIESPLMRLSLRQGSPVVVIDDPALVPEGYLRFPPAPPPEPDKPTIAAALKSGESVPGCRLERGTPSLMVR